jgi:hypothetical protein
MRLSSGLIFLIIVVAGALVLCPAVAYLGIEPLPGDISLNWDNHRLFLPFTQSVIASVSLGLLFLWARK